ncbi:hypothetical protein DL96DRAFT_1822518 [Flagelloscypha sp. PMI_526]|nr:hypothetical protein DL96DRAFT_1822518 [Flagelloscypha sp. PMI_526]
MASAYSPIPGAYEALAPIFIGYLFNILLCGILIHQVYIYHIAFPDDFWGLKVIVYAVFLIELGQSIVQIKDNFEMDVLRYGDPSILEDSQTGWLSIPLLSEHHPISGALQIPLSSIASMSSAIVQGFFGYRILSLSGSWVAAGIVWFFATIHFGAGLAQGIISKGLSLPELIVQTRVPIIIWTGSTAITDVLIAILLGYYLTRLRTGMSDTNNVVTRLIRLIVGTGFLTGNPLNVFYQGIILMVHSSEAIGALLILILYFEATRWIFLFAPSISKFHGNSMMIMFNRRIEIRANKSFIEPGGQSKSETNTFRVAPTKDTGLWELQARHGATIGKHQPLYPELENQTGKVV